MRLCWESVYDVRMARANITVPDALLDSARAAGINVSRVSASALSDELDRRAKLAALERYLQELEAVQGPISEEDQAAAKEWADAAFGRGAPANVARNHKP